MFRRIQCAAVLAAAATLLAGCELWGSLFSATEEEAKAATEVVVNAFVDTYPSVTSDEVSYDPDASLLTYSSADGTFVCEYDVVGDKARHVFSGYRPRFSDYTATGELTTEQLWGPPLLTASTSGSVELAGGPVSTVTVELSVHLSEKDDPSPDCHGSVTANGRDFNDLEEWGIYELLMTNLAVLIEVRQLMTE